MLKGLFHPACLARVVFWFAFVVAIFMAHENAKGQPKDDTYKECWVKPGLLNCHRVATYFRSPCSIVFCKLL